MVQSFAGSRLCQTVRGEFIRQWLVWSVGLDQQPVGRHMVEPFSLPLFARMRKITGKGEVSPQFRKRRYHLPRTAIGVEKKTAFRPRFGAQQFEHASPGLEAMNTHWQLTLRCHSELPG